MRHSADGDSLLEETTMAATGPTGSFPTASTPPGGPFNQPGNTIGRSFTASEIVVPTEDVHITGGVAAVKLPLELQMSGGIMEVRIIPHPRLIARTEEMERVLKGLTDEVTRVRAELRAHAEQSRIGHNGPPEPINIDDAVHDVEVGIASLRILRAALGGELAQLGAEIHKALLQVAYEGLKRAWLAVVGIGKWLLGITTKFAGGVAYAAGVRYGDDVLAYLENNLPKLIDDLKPILRSLGM
jgi:hypothetical protein